ncbi:DUF1771-domain-containing protein [Wallemia mellicola]|nr:DUF1771-domain-containing protein [Wallemia mellicola]
MDEDDEDDEEEEIDGEYEQAQPFGAVQDSDDDDDDEGDNDIQEDLDDDDTNQALIVQSADKSENSESESDNDDDDIHKSIKASQNLDRQRGQAVVAQLQSYDKLLEVRIGMQKAVTQVNNICADEDKDFISGNEDEIENTIKALNELSESVFSIREKFIKYDSNTEIPPRKRPRLDDKNFIQGAAKDSIDMATSYEPQLIDTLKTTSNKVSLANTKGFSAVNKDAWSQVEDVLREYPKLRQRVGVRRGNSDATGQFEAEVFDDGDFYQTLLKEIIESKTGQLEDEEIVRTNKKKVKKDVDTRATKGRKIKYNVHDKLQNFMVPIPPPKESWAESQINELFSSLLEDMREGPNAYLHTRSYLSTLQKFSQSAPSTPKLANGPQAQTSEDITATLISELENDGKEFEDKEDILRSNLATLIGRTPSDEEILQLMHAHKDDITGAPFTQKRTPSRPVSRPNSRPWTPTQGPTTPTFGKITPLMLSPSLSTSQMQSFLPPGIGSQPSSPLASPRPLNKRAAEFKPPASTSDTVEEDVGNGMTPLDVLWTIFAPSGITYDELESTLIGNSFDFELTLNELSERRSLAAIAMAQKAPPNNLSQRHQNPAGGRVCRYYLAGECRRSDCRFSHDIERALCRFWLRGNCIKQNCDFLHQLPPKQEVESTLSNMFETNASIIAEEEKEKATKVQSVEEAFPGLHKAHSATSQKQYTPRWSTAVKVNQPIQNKPTRANPVESLKKASTSKPRSSPRIRLRQPTLLPTLPTGSTLNSLYMSYRNSSISLGTARNSLLSKAADAYRKGDGAAAKEFSKEAHELNERMMGENAKAAGNLVKERRKAIQEAIVAGAGTAGYEGDETGRRSRGKACGNGLGVVLGMAAREGLTSADERMESVLDLHGLHSSEATEVLEEFLLALEREHFLGIAYVIVGETKHTGTQDPLRGASKQRLNAGVKEFLDKWGYPFIEIDATTLAKPFDKRQNLGLVENCYHDFAITFDDGSVGAEYDLVDLFNENESKATMFLNGFNYNCIYEEDSVERIRNTYNSGMLIGSHTWSHRNLGELSEAEIDEQVELVNDAIWKIIGVRPKFLRPPYGSAPEWAVNYIQEKHGMVVVNWSEDSLDSQGASADESIGIYDGFTDVNEPHLTLNHETYETTPYTVMPSVVPSLKERGFNLITVAECLDLDAYLEVGEPQARDETWTCEGKPAPLGG